MLRRWKDGKVIGLTKLQPHARIKYSAPYYLIHRADLHDALHRLALVSGATVKVAHKVVDYDESVPSLTTESGQTFTADLIIAADGGWESRSVSLTAITHHPSRRAEIHCASDHLGRRRHASASCRICRVSSHC